MERSKGRLEFFYRLLPMSASVNRRGRVHGQRHYSVDAPTVIHPPIPGWWRLPHNTGYMQGELVPHRWLLKLPELSPFMTALIRTRARGTQTFTLPLPKCGTSALP